MAAGYGLLWQGVPVLVSLVEERVSESRIPDADWAWPASGSILQTCRGHFPLNHLCRYPGGPVPVSR